MQGTYNYLQLQRDLNMKLGGRRAELNVSDSNIERDIINDAVHCVISEVDLRGTIRRVLLTPNLMDRQYDYSLPNDVKDEKIIDLSPQTDTRGEHEYYDLVPPEEFDRRKLAETGLFTIIDDDLTRTLRVSQNVDDKTQVIANFNTINADGDTWRGFTGVSSSDVKSELDDFIEGSGAVRFADTIGADTVSGIENTITSVNISDFLSRGSLFVRGRLDTGDTNIQTAYVRLGSDSSNYYQFSDSTQNDSSPFQSGWNFIRFDMSSKTTTGTPVDTAIDYAAVFWGKVASTHFDTGFAFDDLFFKRGKYYNLDYYSRFAWADTAVVYKENSTTDSDALQVQNTELELITAKMAEKAAIFLNDFNRAKFWGQYYEQTKKDYQMNNPSRARVLTSSRHYFQSVEGISPHFNRERDS